MLFQIDASEKSGHYYLNYNKWLYTVIIFRKMVIYLNGLANKNYLHAYLFTFQCKDNLKNGTLF